MMHTGMTDACIQDLQAAGIAAFMVVILQKGMTDACVQDLLAAGIAGLQKAINRFDPSRGFKFSTYSHWWIRQTIQRTVIQHGRVIRCAALTFTRASFIVGSSACMGGLAVCSFWRCSLETCGQANSGRCGYAP